MRVDVFILAFQDVYVAFLGFQICVLFKGDDTYVV